MKRVFAGATGLVGKALVQNALKQNIECVVIGRSVRHINKVFGSDVTPVSWDEFENEGKDILSSSQAIINLAGTNIGQTLWTKRRMEDIISSRVESTQAISKVLCDMARNTRAKEVPHFINASAIGVYGHQEERDDGTLPGAFTECAVLQGPGTDFLSQVGRQWEAATSSASSVGVRTTLLRLGVVLSRDGGALPPLALQVRMFVGGKIGSGNQPMSWVSIHDVQRAVDYIIDNECVGPINVVAPGAVTQADFVAALARHFHRPTFLFTPAFLFKTLMGQMGEELILKGTHVYPEYLEQAGFKFQHPDLDTALAGIYQ
eukprot:TRINITY_DN41458_c0_g1_i1.p1 TRINITY_DN41458_c0_g1~~TRINITY_DN41458_c0_g1_i1.p1  ORF type:complete len:318 (-),score=68.14 TRINITY_DN41458_c0_g1_i1:74-1027(-)